MPAPIDVALVGVSNTLGETLLSLLEEREFPVGKLFLLEHQSRAGNRLQFRDKYHTVMPLTGFDFSQVQLAIFAVDEVAADAFVPQAVASGCVVIDHSARFRDQPEVPLVVAEVNPEAIADFRASGIIACPSPITTLMLLALKPLHDAAGIRRVQVTSFQAVTDLGKAGAEELAKQTTALLNMQPLKHKVFGQQIAFNVLGQTGPIENDGYSREETGMLRESQKVLGDETIVINAMAVRVPVFFGHCAALMVETRDKLGAQSACDVLAKAPAVNVSAAVCRDQQAHQETMSLPTPVSDAAGNDKLLIGRLRDSVASPHGLDLWIVGDNVRRGAALNSLQIAELLVKDFL